ncbi:MAG: S-adenosylmethionine:tRNA ribosyltransferase-isomerase [Bauldia sp.]|nr:S-adenosylmethionine:tRNA ribosyltransferase-isomerase [Bauldia sp.]
MTAAHRPGIASSRLVIVEASGRIRHMARDALATLLRPGDLVVVNDAATLPASFHGTHLRSNKPIEIRLAGWVAIGDPTRFLAIAFGAGDHRTRTEDRLPPPPLTPGDRLVLGPLVAVIEDILGHPRLVALRFEGERAAILRGFARHGRPVQYAHVSDNLALRDVWTPVAAEPMAFEPPSAGFALDWRILAAWRGAGIRMVGVTHAAGLSSTGDETLDARLPFDEVYRVPKATAAAIATAKEEGRRVVAVGTTVVRCLEAAAATDALVRAGDGIARGRIGRDSGLRIVDAILTGVHAPGESHFELLRAFADDATLDRAFADVAEQGYRSHEFGDSMLLESRSREAIP